MATLITMPRLSPTMEEGVLAKWIKKEGDRITPGDIIAEVETDKANMDFPLEEEGVLLRHLVAEGTTVKLGAPVAILGEEGEDISAALAAAATAGPAEPAAPTTEGQKPAPMAASQGPMAASQGPMAASPSPPAAAPKRILASPLARRLAEEAGVDLRQVQGSGPGGRVVKRDIERAMARTVAAPQPAPELAPAPAAPAQVLALSTMRRTIARRLTEAKQTVPHFYLTAEARVDALWRFREELNATLRAAGQEQKVSFNDLVVKSLARALTVVPAAHRSWSEQGLVVGTSVDIGVAVAIDEGLITPVVRGAASKSLGAIAAETRQLAERARQKKLRPEEYQGASFTVSNLGMYGIREFFAIINPPEPGILAVGQIEKRPVVLEGPEGDRIGVERRMTLTLSCDHRVMDGVLGARLLAEVVRGLEQPMLLVL
ncbi:MAG: pyruvate dehydrogenase complex dihydrolipoamide acetyltransferase [Myxococcota bacterium]|nr:pyruvate dehydrogenase complex dihydrolipoamide acetyltransferase [Myxococcota bacterium]